MIWKRCLEAEFNGCTANKPIGLRLNNQMPGASMQFNAYLGIDYSGAAQSSTRSATIQVYLAEQGTEPRPVSAPGSRSDRKRNWNRLELADWLADFLLKTPGVVVGIDHGFSFPIAYFQRYQLDSWDQFLADFHEHWPTDETSATVEQFRADSQRVGQPSELRLTERWTPAAKSVFQFDVQGSVAKSTHAGLPFLRKLRISNAQIHCWPFDGWQIPAGKSVVAEIFPSLFRSRYPREDRTVDQQDAYAVSRWFAEMDQMNRLASYFDPPLTRKQKSIAKLEGWILGVV